MSDRLTLVGSVRSPLDDYSIEDLIKAKALGHGKKSKVERDLKGKDLAWMWEGSKSLVQTKPDLDPSAFSEAEMQSIRESPEAFGDLLFGWKPHSEGQRAVLCDEHRTVVVAAGRRWGKSASMAIKLLHLACTRPSYQFIISITLDQTRFIFDAAYKMLIESPLKALVVKVTFQPFPLIELANGSLIKCYSSAHEGKYLRGNKAHRVIVDEAGRLQPKILDEVIRPMLLDYQGQLVLISTPAGHNDFFRYWEQGQPGPNRDPKSSSYRFSSYENAAYPHFKEEIDAYKSKMPEVAFRCEYLAEFIPDKDFVFKWSVIDRSVDEDVASLSFGEFEHNYVMGVDVGKLEDYTVVCVLDVTDPSRVSLVKVDRFKDIDYGLIVNRIADCIRCFNPTRVIVDATGAGNPVVDFLQPDFPQVEGYTFTNSLSNPRKVFLIDQLRLGFEQNRVRIPDFDWLVEELKFYEYHRDKDSGVIKMGAQAGYHDDGVTSLALAWSGCSVPSANVDVMGVEHSALKERESVFAVGSRVDLGGPLLPADQVSDYGPLSPWNPWVTY